MVEISADQGTFFQCTRSQMPFTPTAAFYNSRNQHVSIIMSSQVSPPPLKKKNHRCCPGLLLCLPQQQGSPTSLRNPYLDVASLIFIWVSAVNDNKLFNEVGKLATQNRRYLWRESQGESTLAARNMEIPCVAGSKRMTYNFWRDVF